MSKEHFGTIVRRQGEGLNHSVKPGDEIDIFELADYLDLSGVDRNWQPEEGHGSADLTGEAIRHAEAIESKGVTSRVHKRYNCTCRTHDPVLIAKTVAIAGQGKLWAVVMREGIPSAYRSEYRRGDRKAWPLHTHLNGSPHIEIVSCKRCGVRWAVCLTREDIVLVPSRKTRYGSSVAEDTEVP